LTSPQQALHAIASTATTVIDAVRICFTAADGSQLCRFGINVASFGLGADTVAVVNQWREMLPHWVGGRARFVAAAVRALGRYKNVPIAVGLDHDKTLTVQSNLIVVANGRFAGGGMMFAPHAELDDGLLEVVLTDRLSRLGIIMELRRIGRGGHLKNPKVSVSRAREVHVAAERPVAIDIDGDMCGYTPARLTIIPSIVRFVTPTAGRD
jgi:diacylglycerol kinase family enzyme